MHTLFGSLGSGSAAVEMALVVAGVPFREVHASTWEADSAQAELKRHNPMGQIPTLLLPDGSVLTESAAILIHLGLAHPSSGLLPNSTAARAQVIRGLVFIAANCYAAIGVIDYPERWCEGGRKATHERIRAGARARLHALWVQFADQFPAAPYLGGEQLGALDLLAVVVSRWSGARAHLSAQRPAFVDVLGRIETRGAVLPVLKRHWPKAYP
jgi:GST-like protein